MQYALVNSIKSLPQKGLKGICRGCGAEVIAKCGPIKVHHWAHVSNIDCDYGHEPETQWHRDWKNQFPEQFREVHFEDGNLNRYHRADIHTPSEVTIEFQHSPISTEEFKSRCKFYKNLIWVIDGTGFEKNFSIGEAIPDPSDPILKEFDFSIKSFLGEVFFKKSDLEYSGGSYCRSYTTYNDELKDLRTSNIHFSFTWPRPRINWLSKAATVFIDFGTEWLYWLKHREQVLDTFWYLHRVSKVNFINKYSQSL